MFASTINPTRLRYRIDTRMLKKRVGDRWFGFYEDVASELYEAIRHHGRHVECPVHGGRHGDAFRLFPDAETTGGAVCNTCGKFHDGISLLMWLKGWSFLEVIDAIEEWLAGQEERERPDGDFQVTSTATAVREPLPWVADYINRTLDKVIFDHPRLAAYYRHRGLQISPSPYLGIIQRARYQNEWEDEYLPAMVGFFQAPGGKIVCVHRTYLDTTGDGKADVDHPKKFSPALYRGALKGAAIRLQDCDDLVGVSEGVETAEAVYQATGIPTWACGSACGLESFIPPAGVTKVAIWADNDRLGVGQLAAARLSHRLYNVGISVKLMVPKDTDCDWLDILIRDGSKSLRAAMRRSRLYHFDQPTPIPDISDLAGIVS